jgi:membrane protein
MARHISILGGALTLAAVTNNLRRRGGGQPAEAPRRERAPEPAEAHETPPPKTVLEAIKTAVTRFINDDCMTMAAALAYYTTFSLPPLLLIIISVAGMVLGREQVEEQLRGQIGALIGGETSQQVETMVQSAEQSAGSGAVGAALGILALLFGATTTFAQLQYSFNQIWRVKPDPNAGGIKNFITKRVWSLGMILGIAFLLLVSLAVSAALTSFGGVIESYLPEELSSGVMQAISFAFSFAIIALLFGAMFKVLPDAHMYWKHALVGGAVTAGLFTIGKYLIGVYLGASGAVTPYGAAGSMILIVLWVYYSALIVLLGAEFTVAWARMRGARMGPEPGAVRVVQREEQKPSTSAA